MKLTLWINEQAEGPFDLCQVVSLYQQEIISGVTQAMAEAPNDSWKPLKDLVPSLSSVITTAAMTRKLIAGLHTEITTRDSPAKPVSVKDIDMPFASMVGFMIKWAIAAIPAAIILAVLFFLIARIFGGFLAGLSR